jgi:hypothetical protein
MVRPEGLEPPTGGLEIRCSIQLSYGRTAGFAGAPECITGQPPAQRSGRRPLRAVAHVRAFRG